MGEFHKNGAHAIGLPRKLDFRKDRDRQWYAVHGRIIVSLDGEDIQANLVAFDVSKGTLVRYKMNEDGAYKLNHKSKKPVTETLKGKVEVRWA